MSHLKRKANRTKLLYAAPIITLVAALGLTSTAEAFGGKGRHDGRGKMGSFGPMLLQGLDQDSDGKITEQEVEARLLALFSDADTDKDGSVSLDEFKAVGENLAKGRQQEHKGSWQSRADRRIERMFQRADENDDGEVSEQEFRDSFAGHIERIAERATKMQERLAERFTMLDTDKDGQISKEEFFSNSFGDHYGRHRYGRGRSHR